MILYNNSLSDTVCMCAGGIYIYMHMFPYPRMCYPQMNVHTYTDLVHVYVSCFHMLVQVVCVFPSAMESVLF